MGLLDKIRGKLSKQSAKDNDVIGYALWYNPPGKKSGRKMVCRFDRYPSMEELMAVIQGFGEEGYYSLQEIKRAGKGEIFGSTVWKQKFVYDSDDNDDEDDVVDEELAGKKKRRRRSKNTNPLGGLLEVVEGLKQMQEQMEALGEIGTFLARMSGRNVLEIPPDKSVEEYMLDMMSQLRNKYEKMRELFGDSRVKTDETQIPVEGKIPAWVVYAPRVLDTVLDNVERRLAKFGLLDDGKSNDVEVPEFPELKK